MNLLCKIGFHKWEANQCLRCGKKQVFKAVTIGKQIWMVENLNINHFRNGDPIPEANGDEWITSFERGLPVCSKSEKKFGRFYNWFAVNDKRGLAPLGWRIPSNRDIELLAEAVDYNSNALKDRGQGTGDGIGTNASGFSALLWGGSCFLWTSTQRWSNTAYSFDIRESHNGMGRSTRTFDEYCQVRCIKE